MLDDNMIEEAEILHCRSISFLAKRSRIWLKKFWPTSCPYRTSFLSLKMAKKGSSQCKRKKRITPKEMLAQIADNDLNRHEKMLEEGSET